MSILTYQTVIGVRYHELVKLSAGEYLFGRFLSDLSAKKGGFLPIVWDAPKSDTYAVQDIGMVVDHLKKTFTFTSNPEETLAVLHNKNRLVHAFSRSGWIQDTLGEILSRSVRSCAGMTAKVTIIAQTRIGFFSGLRRIPHGEEAENSFEVQRKKLRLEQQLHFFCARCCLGKVPGGAPFSQLHKGDGKIARTGQIMQIYKTLKQISGSNKFLIAGDGKRNGCESRETELIGEMHRMRGVVSKVVREAPSRLPRCTGTMK